MAASAAAAKDGTLRPDATMDRQATMKSTPLKTNGGHPKPPSAAAAAAAASARVDGTINLDGVVLDAVREEEAVAAAAVEAAEAAYDQDEVVPMSEATPSSTRVVRVAKNRGAGEAMQLELPQDGGLTSVTIGRAKSNIIALQTDPSVSANHAEMSVIPLSAKASNVAASQGVEVEECWAVRDLGSSNGTALRLSSERKASRPFILRPGHRLTLGSGPKSSELTISRFRKGSAERKGRRPTMEDALVMFDALPAPPAYEPYWRRVSFYAVFDGHAGPEASAYCKVHMHRHLLSYLQKAVDSRSDSSSEGGSGSSSDAVSVVEIASALTEAFAVTDSAFLESSNSSAGTTAITAIVTPSHCIVGNCGDSRAYIWRNGKALRMSCDHKPDRMDEAARITAAGGWVSHGRVLHTLAVSRALGDRDFKLHPRSAAASLPFTAPLVSAEPELRVSRVFEGDELLLACDGLWDVMTPEMAFEFLHSHGGLENPTRACQLLCQAADEEYHSADNISAVYVRLSSAVPPASA